MNSIHSIIIFSQQITCRVRVRQRKETKTFILIIYIMSVNVVISLDMPPTVLVFKAVNVHIVSRVHSQGTKIARSMGR